MRSKINEGYESKEKGSDHIENIILDTKNSKRKNKIDDLTKQEASMEMLKQPPSERDFITL
jgi:hypothetical protein